MNAAQQLARQQTGPATLAPAEDIKPGTVIQGVNGTAFLVTATEKATDPRTGRPAIRYTLDGVTIPFYARPGQNIRHWPAAEPTDRDKFAGEHLPLFEALKAAQDRFHAATTVAEHHAASDAERAIREEFSRSMDRQYIAWRYWDEADV